MSKDEPINFKELTLCEFEYWERLQSERDKYQQAIELAVVAFDTEEVDLTEIQQATRDVLTQALSAGLKIREGK